MGLIALLLALFLTFGGCMTQSDAVLSSLGRYREKEYYTKGVFQDFTDYAKYTYDTASLAGNRYFQPMSAQGETALKTHIEDFEQWVSISDEDGELAQNYDFDLALITDDDYWYIYDDPQYPELGNYDVYFFDMGSMTLYYFHNNI